MPLVLTHQRLHYSSRPRVGGNETAGNRDHFSRSGLDLDSRLLACPPKKDHCQDYESEQKEGHAKEDQKDE